MIAVGTYQGVELQGGRFAWASGASPKRFMPSGRQGVLEVSTTDLGASLTPPGQACFPVGHLAQGRRNPKRSGSNCKGHAPGRI
jgi:hypothetical protein